MSVEILILLISYFLPAIIASLRGHPQRGTIIIIDLFLGWTLPGWVVALAWSFSGIRKCCPAEQRQLSVRQSDALNRFVGEQAPFTPLSTPQSDQANNNPFPVGSSEAPTWYRGNAKTKAGGMKLDRIPSLKFSFRQFLQASTEKAG